MHLRKMIKGLQRNNKAECWSLMMTNINILSTVLFGEEWESEESCSSSHYNSASSSGSFRGADNIETLKVHFDLLISTHNTGRILQRITVQDWISPKLIYLNQHQIIFDLSYLLIKVPGLIVQNSMVHVIRNKNKKTVMYHV